MTVDTNGITVKLTADKITMDSLNNLPHNPKSGATSVFLGTTRDTFEDKTVVTLEYEAYDSMAIKSLQDICKEAKESFNLFDIIVIHRIGLVPVTETSVLIAATSKHRKDAIRAVEYTIDRLKAETPIWKKEIYFDGSSMWKANCPGCVKP
ncbi:hypothetical protein MP638_000792 [Amoeboaphelidium occidentale]|nr:hypothetical protein MP638_000792 [Amoeboaphelidium occidentale]